MTTIRKPGAGSRIDFASQADVEAQENEKKALHPKALAWFVAWMQGVVITLKGLVLGKDNEPGASRTIEAKGSAADIGLNLKHKGTGKLKLEGASYVVTKEKIFVINIHGEVIAAYEIEDEFVAVPPTLTSPGTPGQKAWDEEFLYYCVGWNKWIKILSISADLDFMEVYVAVPPTMNYAGSKGQKAFDPDTNRMYEHLGTKWIYYNVVSNW